MWLSKGEVKRIERERSEARERALVAEARLEDERRAKDALSLALMDLAAKKLGQYPVSDQVKPKPPEKPETEEQYFERLKLIYPSIWSYFQQVASQNGKLESEALDWLNRHHLGLPMPFEQQEM